MPVGLNNKWSKNFDKRSHCNLCRYWRLNDPFCCEHRSKDCQCFWMGQKTPKNCPIMWRISTPSNTWFLGLTQVTPPPRHLARFSRYRWAHERDQHTDTHIQADRPRYSICSKRVAASYLADILSAVSSLPDRQSYDSTNRASKIASCRKRCCASALFTSSRMLSVSVPVSSHRCCNQTARQWQYEVLHNCRKIAFEKACNM